MNPAMRLVLAFTVIGICVDAFAADGAAAAPNQLGMFAGTWKDSGNFMQDGKTVHVTGSITCNWSSAAHVFLVCDGVAQIEGVAQPQHQLSVYTWDAANRKYAFANITPGQIASPDLGFSGKTWTYTGHFTDKQNKTHWFRTLNIFDSPDHYRYEIQNSGDGQHWTTTGSGESRRQQQ